MVGQEGMNVCLNRRYINEQQLKVSATLFSSSVFCTVSHWESSELLIRGSGVILLLEQQLKNCFTSLCIFPCLQVQSIVSHESVPRGSGHCFAAVHNLFSLFIGHLLQMDSRWITHNEGPSYVNSPEGQMVVRCYVPCGVGFLT